MSRWLTAALWATTTIIGTIVVVVQANPISRPYIPFRTSPFAQEGIVHKQLQLTEDTTRSRVKSFLNDDDSKKGPSKCPLEFKLGISKQWHDTSGGDEASIRRPPVLYPIFPATGPGKQVVYLTQYEHLDLLSPATFQTTTSVTTGSGPTTKSAAKASHAVQEALVQAPSFPLLWESSAFHTSPLIHDVNGDGILDVIVADYDGGISMMGLAQVPSKSRFFQHTQVPRLYVRHDWVNHRIRQAVENREQEPNSATPGDDPHDPYHSYFEYYYHDAHKPETLLQGVSAHVLEQDPDSIENLQARRQRRVSHDPTELSSGDEEGSGDEEEGHERGDIPEEIETHHRRLQEVPRDQMQREEEERLRREEEERLHQQAEEHRRWEEERRRQEEEQRRRQGQEEEQRQWEDENRRREEEDRRRREEEERRRREEEERRRREEEEERRREKELRNRDDGEHRRREEEEVRRREEEEHRRREGEEVRRREEEEHRRREEEEHRRREEEEEHRRREEEEHRRREEDHRREQEDLRRREEEEQHRREEDMRQLEMRQQGQEMTEAQRKEEEKRRKFEQYQQERGLKERQEELRRHHEQHMQEQQRQDEEAARREEEIRLEQQRGEEMREQQRREEEIRQQQVREEEMRLDQEREKQEWRAEERRQEEEMQRQEGQPSQGEQGVQDPGDDFALDDVAYMEREFGEDRENENELTGDDMMYTDDPEYPRYDDYRLEGPSPDSELERHHMIDDEYNRYENYDDYYASGHNQAHNDYYDNKNYIRVPPHILCTPVIVEIPRLYGGNDAYDDMLIVAVSYYFDEDEYSGLLSYKRFAQTDAGGETEVDRGYFVATALLAFQLGEYGRWAAQEHIDLSADFTAPPNATLVDAIETRADNTRMGAFALASPVVADIDGDGKPEAILGTSMGMLYVLDGRNFFKRDNWPIQLEAAIEHRVLVEDVQGNTNLEIFVSDVRGNVICFSHDGTVIWNRNLVTSVDARRSLTKSSPMVLGDIDGDGDLDIVVVGQLNDAVLVYAFDAASGRDLGAFPIEIALKEVDSNEDPSSLVQPLVVDLHTDQGYYAEYISRNVTRYSRKRILKPGTSPGSPHGGSGDGLHVVLPLGQDLFIIESSTGCVQKFMVGDEMTAMVQVDDVHGTNRLDLVISTQSGTVITLESAASYHPLNTWTNGELRRGNTQAHGMGATQGIFVHEMSRQYRDVFGVYVPVTFEIFDHRPNIRNEPDKRKYAVEIRAGTSSERVLFRENYNMTGVYTERVYIRFGPGYYTLSIVMRTSHGLVYEDYFSLGYNVRFLDGFGVLLWLPLVIASMTILLCGVKKANWDDEEADEDRDHNTGILGRSLPT